MGLLIRNLDQASNGVRISHQRAGFGPRPVRQGSIAYGRGLSSLALRMAPWDLPPLQQVKCRIEDADGAVATLSLAPWLQRERSPWRVGGTSEAVTGAVLTSSFRLGGLD